MPGMSGVPASTPLSTDAATTQSFGDAATAGAVGRGSDAGHKHAMPVSWTKVAAGTLGAVTSLSLASLSGYRRYRLVLHGSYVGNAGMGEVTLKLNNAAAHMMSKVHVIGTGAATGVNNERTATARLASIGSSGAASQGECVLDLLVTHLATASRNTAFQFHIAASAGNQASTYLGVGGGIEANAVASITQIVIGWDNALAGGHYTLYGSNEVA